MTTQTNTQRIAPREDVRFMLLAGIIFLIVMGMMMLVFSTAYINDVQTLRAAPEAVWNFLCGTPTDNNITLPLLLTIAIACFLGSGGLYIYRWWLGRNRNVKATH